MRIDMVGFRHQCKGGCSLHSWLGDRDLNQLLNLEVAATSFKLVSSTGKVRRCQSIPHPAVFSLHSKRATRSGSFTSLKWSNMAIIKPARLKT